MVDEPDLRSSMEALRIIRTELRDRLAAVERMDKAETFLDSLMKAVEIEREGDFLRRILRTLVRDLNFPEDQAAEHERIERVKRVSIGELGFSVRVLNCLQEEGLLTIGDVMQKTPSELLRIKNFGRRSLNEVRYVLENFGVGLQKEHPHGL